MRSRISAAVALGVLVALIAPGAAPAATRAELRSAGGDRATALRVADALFAQPLDLQLTKVRCERAGAQSVCGLTLAGVKFKRTLSTADFQRDVDGLVRTALGVDPRIAEVDLWVTVPAGAGEGAVVSGDFAVPTSATVYAMSVPRAKGAGAGIFWDPTFRHELDAGSNG